MDNFINNFVQYEGVSSKFPSHLSCFKYLSHPFFIEVPSSSVAIYTLNKVSVRVKRFEVDSTGKNWQLPKAPVSTNTLLLPVFMELEAILHYTTTDLIHSIHSTTYNFSLFDALTYEPSSTYQKSLKPSLYVEDIFAYCPDMTHIYGHISLLLALPS
ncbi:MAG: hypothetical protein RSD26_09590 [Cellulosilyticaceae bacterium]